MQGMDADAVICNPKGADKIHRVHFSKDNRIPFVIPFETYSSSRVPKLREGLFPPAGKQLISQVQAKLELKTLKEICLSLVSRFAECIESLEGFPIIMGEELWRQCVKQDERMMKSCQSTQTIIELFEDAYGEEMLQSCRLNQILVINNYEQELLILLRHCRKIDFTGAKLCDNDDIIVALPIACPHLTHLNLSQNNFSSVVLRILFGLPLDPPKCQRLEYFDISKNPSVSIKGLVRYVLNRALPNLKVVKSNVSNEQLTNLHGWQRVRDEMSKQLETVTSGIATDLLMKWSRRFVCKGKNTELAVGGVSSSGVSKFYGPNEEHLRLRQRDANPKEEFNEVYLVRKCDTINQPPKKKPRLILKRQDQKNINDMDEDSILQLYAN